MSESSRRDVLVAAARWALAGGSVAGILALSTRRGDACSLPLACVDCALASRCTLPKREATRRDLTRRHEERQRSGHER